MEESLKRIKALENKILDLELAINFSDDGLHLLDKNGVTILMNDYCRLNEGLNFEEIKGKSMKQLQNEGILSESVTVKVLEKKQNVTLIQHVKSGKDMLVTGTPIFDDNGDIFRVMVNSRDITELNRLKQKLIETQVLYNETRDRLSQLDSIGEIPSYIICKSPIMQKVLKTAILVSGVDSNILIIGGSGTGKGIISKFIHDKSKRKDKPFIKIDCGSIPETLFESELFGYEGGAFTGASTKGKIGLMELAHGGTLFLDEIGELPINCQAKLLRAIQDKEIVRVGGNKFINIDVRFISATNRDLEQMVQNNTFREDLYYRINVVPIKMPSLRERQEDIPDLIHSFVKKLCDKYDFKRRFNLNAIDSLMKLDWKGNIRELENIVEMVVITSQKNFIDVEDLPQSVLNKVLEKNILVQKSGTLNNRISLYERMIFEDLINKGNNPIQIAKELGVDVTTVRRKLTKHKIVYKKKMQ